MKKFHLYLVLFILFACQKEEDTLRKKVGLESFHTIELNEAFEVKLIEGSEYSLEMEGIESFINKMEYQVTDSILVIDNSKNFKWSNPQNNIPKLWITCPQLEVVRANESCNIQTLNAITTKEFGIILGSKANIADIETDNQIVFYWNDFPCSGKLTLRGQTKELKIWNTALMTVDASLLTTEFAYISNDSKGDCLVNVSETLEYNLNGEGDLIVFGNPAEIIDQGSSNSGSVLLR
jgi:hypothetical protein